MPIRIPLADRIRLSNYLLGQLSSLEADEVEDHFSKDREYFAWYEEVERLLICEYVAGMLDFDERTAFQRYYLVNASRRRQVAIVEALLQVKKQSQRSRLPQGTLRMRLAWSVLSVALVLGTGLFYTNMKSSSAVARSADASRNGMRSDPLAKPNLGGGQISQMGQQGQQPSVASATQPHPKAAPLHGNGKPLLSSATRRSNFINPVPAASSHANVTAPEFEWVRKSVIPASNPQTDPRAAVSNAVAPRMDDTGGPTRSSLTDNEPSLSSRIQIAKLGFFSSSHVGRANEQDVAEKITEMLSQRLANGTLTTHGEPPNRANDDPGSLYVTLEGTVDVFDGGDGGQNVNNDDSKGGIPRRDAKDSRKSNNNAQPDRVTVQIVYRLVIGGSHMTVATGTVHGEANGRIVDGQRASASGTPPGTAMSSSDAQKTGDAAIWQAARNCVDRLTTVLDQRVKNQRTIQAKFPNQGGGMTTVLSLAANTAQIAAGIHNRVAVGDIFEILEVRPSDHSDPVQDGALSSGRRPSKNIAVKLGEMTVTKVEESVSTGSYTGSLPSPDLDSLMAFKKSLPK